MFALRRLSIRDVAMALRRRELGLACRITENLCTNAWNTARMRRNVRLVLRREP